MSHVWLLEADTDQTLFVELKENKYLKSKCILFKYLSKSNQCIYKKYSINLKAFGYLYHFH